MPKTLVPSGVRVSARSRNPLKAAVRGPSKPKVAKKKRRNMVVRRGSHVNPLVAHQLDRIVNCRAHFGEVQPRARTEVGILSSMTKTISTVTTTNVYKAIAMCATLNNGFIHASSASATTNFADSALVAGSSSYQETQMDRWSRAAGSLAVSLGMSALEAAGFVTYGSIPGNYCSSAATFNTLDPGDLINAPGATTIPLWDFINNPPSGFMRKVSPAADTFLLSTDTLGGADQISVPFILFNIPSASVASFTALVMSYNTYDFYPDITDAGIPSVAPLMSVESAQAYDVAANIAARIVNGFVKAFTPTMDTGAIGQSLLSQANTAIEGYSARQDAYRAGMRNSAVPRLL